MGLGSIRRLIDRIADAVSSVRGASLRFAAHELGGSPSVPPRPMRRADPEAIACVTTLRCRIVSVEVGEATQGSVVTFLHEGERFDIQTARWRAILAGRLLGAEVEIRANLTREVSGRVIRGHGLSAISPTSPRSAVEAWREHIRGSDLDGRSWSEIKKEIRGDDGTEPVERAFERRGAGAPRKTPQGRRSGVPLSPVARRRRPRDPDRSGCTKARYSSMTRARKAMRRIKGGDRLRAYRCPDCTGFHLTSKTGGGRRKRRYKRTNKRAEPEVGTE